MCNLSDGIEERAAAKATKIATEIATKVVTEQISEKFILSMYKNDYTLDQIAKVAEMSVEDVEAIIKKNALVMA